MNKSVAGAPYSKLQLQSVTQPNTMVKSTLYKLTFSVIALHY